MSDREREARIRERWERPPNTGHATDIAIDAAADIRYLLARVERYREALEEIAEHKQLPFSEIAHRTLNEGEDDADS